MKWKSSSIPTPSKGVVYTDKKIVVPNQSMSLEEILHRFTRGEPLAIGREVQYHESDDDLEKVSNMDLVDRQEFVEKLKSTRKEYDKQEKARKKAEADRIEKLAVEKLAAEKKAAEQPPTAK